MYNQLVKDHTLRRDITGIVDTPEDVSIQLGPGAIWSNSYNFCLDGNYAIYMSKGGVWPDAVISYDMKQDGLLIKQIQSNRYPTYKGWEKDGVRIVEELAKQHNKDG